MTLLYIDGFDHYSNATGAGNRLYELEPTWWSQTGLTANQTSDTDTMPELGSRGLVANSYKNANSEHRRLTRLLPYPVSSDDTVGIGCHIYFSAMPTDGGSTVFYPIWLESRGAWTSNDGRLGLRLTPGGVLELRQNFYSTNQGLGSLLETGSISLSNEVVYHLEWASHFHSSEGWSEVRINGQTVLRYDGALDQSHTAVGFASFWFTSGAAGSITSPSVYYDNLYIWDAEGSVNNDFLGERNVYTIFPDTDEAPQDWTLSSGSDAFDLLNDVPPDPENDYIESSTASEISKFGTADLPSMDISIVGIQTTVQGYKTGTSDTDVSIGLDIDNDLDVGTASLVQDQGVYYSHITEVHPDTGEPLTPAEAQSALIHIERVL